MGAGSKRAGAAPQGARWLAAIAWSAVFPVSAIDAAGSEWYRLSARTCAGVAEMEARINVQATDPAAVERAYEAYMATFTPWVRVHGLVHGTTDYAGVRAFYRSLFGTFQDSVLVSDDIVCAGPMAAQRYHALGRMTGTFDGIEMRNKLVAIRGQTFFRLDADGRIAERWSNHDHAYRLGQIIGAEGQRDGAELAGTLNGPGLTEAQVYRALDAMAEAFNQIEDPARRARDYQAFFAPAVAVHGIDSSQADRRALFAYLDERWRAFPDLVMRYESRLSAWSMGAVRWRATGSQRASYQGYAAGHAPAVLTGESLMRFDVEGRVTEIWVNDHPLPSPHGKESPDSYP